jgi:hypothetical protein
MKPQHILINDTETGLSTNLSIYVENLIKEIKEMYCTNDGLYLEKRLARNVAAVVSIPGINHLEQCINGINDTSYSYIGDNCDNFVHIITPFVSIKINGKIKWQLCSDFQEEHGVIREKEYINYVGFEFTSCDVNRSDYDNFINLYGDLS